MWERSKKLCKSWPSTKNLSCSFSTDTSNGVILSTCLVVSLFPAVKEAAVQRRHNLYRDSIVLTNSDPNLHLLGENSPIDWTEEYGGGQEEMDGGDVGKDGETPKRRRIKQVVSMIQLENNAFVLPNESCLEVPGVDDIPEEETERRTDASTCHGSLKQVLNGTKEDVNKNEVEEPSAVTNKTTLKEEIDVTQVVEEETYIIESAIQEIENAAQEEEHEWGGAVKEENVAESPLKEETADISDKEVDLTPVCQVETPASGITKNAPSTTEEKHSGSLLSDQKETNHITESTKDTHSETDYISPSPHDDSGFQSPANEVEGEEPQTGNEACNDSEMGEDTGKKEDAHVDHQ